MTSLWCPALGFFKGLPVIYAKELHIYVTSLRLRLSILFQLSVSLGGDVFLSLVCFSLSNTISLLSPQKYFVHRAYYQRRKLLFLWFLPQAREIHQIPWRLIKKSLLFMYLFIVLVGWEVVEAGINFHLFSWLFFWTMQVFWRYLLQKNLSNHWLNGVPYAVFGLGDSGYLKYNVNMFINLSKLFILACFLA